MSTAAETIKGQSQAQLIRKRFFGHHAAMVALAVLGALFLFVFTSIGWGPIPGWWKHGYTEYLPIVNNAEPTYVHPFNWGEHPFGQDRTGADMFAMTMRGAQQSLIVMLVVGSIAGTLGVVIGAVSGYFRGVSEAVLMRFTDAIMITPLVLIAAVLGKIAASSSFGRDFGVLMFCLLIGGLIWYGLARLVRAEFLSLREREFVDAARIAGASDGRIIFKHILPNAIGVIIVNTTLLMAEAILLESALSYLGFGVQRPDVSLGQLIVDNQEAFTTRPWLFWWPGLFIVAICLCINFIGDGLRDAFDPRQKKFSARGAAAVDHPELDDMDALAPVIRPRTSIGASPISLPQDPAGRDESLDGGTREPVVSSVAADSSVDVTGVGADLRTGGQLAGSGESPGVPSLAVHDNPELEPHIDIRDSAPRVAARPQGLNEGNAVSGHDDARAPHADVHHPGQSSHGDDDRPVPHRGFPHDGDQSHGTHHPHGDGDPSRIGSTEGKRK